MNVNMNQSSLLTALSQLDGVTRKFDPGTAVFHRGEAPRHITLVREGGIQLDFRPLQSASGAVEHLNNREIWGIQETILESEYEWTGHAVRHLECYLIPCHSFRSMLRENPLFKFKLLSLFATEIQHIRTHYE